MLPDTRSQSHTTDNSWTVCQLGAREHYAIPRSLVGAGVPVRLITDAWQPLNYGIPRFSGRYHTALTGTPTTSFTSGSILFELRHRSKRSSPWERIAARNEWFGRRAAKALNRPANLFSYSYTARLPFARARQIGGIRTILGQIDPGPAEWDIVLGEAERFPELGATVSAPPEAYWESWREEIDSADHIVVNSPWSAKHMPSGRLSVIPLAFTPPRETAGFSRAYPAEFTRERPLRALFLGQANLRKGIARLIASAKLLEGAPVEFHVVGEPEVLVPDRPNIFWHGSCPRTETPGHYRRADLFLFPTLSDGFGLTQLEAMAWKLPSLTTPFCAPVVGDRNNGRILNPAPEILAAEIEALAKEPERLLTWSRNCHLAPEYSLSSIAEMLTGLTLSEA